MGKRFESREPAHESSQFVKGVGPSRQVLLSRLGIETVEDLISHFPRDYYDRSNFVKIAAAGDGRSVTFTAFVLAASLRRLGGGRSIFTVAVGDETGTINLVFFNQPYLEKQFKQGLRIIASGTVKQYRGKPQIIAPEYEFVTGDLDEFLLHTGRITPVYPLTAGISQRMMRRIVKSALDKCRGMMRENLPDELVISQGFMGREESFEQVHYPESWKKLELARRRFKFEEIFFLHLLIRDRRASFSRGKPRPQMPPPYPMLDRLLGNLPFELTSAQKRVLDEVKRDMGSDSGLGRLIQGDVGSGKTVVGLAAMVLAVEKGFQAALMVPTEILATQHYERIESYLEGFPVNTAILIGSMKKSEKERVLDDLKSGGIDMIVGTHALIQERTEFHQLGIAIIDEQHRFGVKQRAKLGSGDLVPHFLVMTATPIPRSLAQTVYGDLDLSMIDELPIGGRKVVTQVVEPAERGDMYETVRRAFASGQQAFILYPLVTESENTDLQAATGGFEILQKGELKDFPLGLLHGRMSFEEKSKAIEMFRRGEIAGLVTTTVIEVGVDIPNASIMIINNPERFGLAQLHQLRGRVGRGGNEGACYLLRSENTGPGGAGRLEFFASTDDGLKVAEEDLRLRGPGEIWGFRQSGYPLFRLVNPLSDHDIVQKSWKVSGRLLGGDPGLEKPENKVVSRYYRLYYKRKMKIPEIG